MRPQDKFGQSKKDPYSGQGDVYNQLAGTPAPGAEDFTTFEVDAANRRNELLFSITTQIEETRGKLKQAELLVERLRQNPVSYTHLTLPTIYSV